MSSRPVSLRIPDDVRSAIEDTMLDTGRDFSSVANEMLSEAVKMRRIPGITFADGPSGRVARVAGTGIEVFEIIGTYRELSANWDDLQSAYHWLSENQIRAALAYADAYPAEIDQRLNDGKHWTADTMWTRYPFTKPRGR